MLPRCVATIWHTRALQVKKRKRKAYAVRRHNESLCTQKQPEVFALEPLVDVVTSSSPDLFIRLVQSLSRVPWVFFCPN